MVRKLRTSLAIARTTSRSNRAGMIGSNLGPVEFMRNLFDVGAVGTALRVTHSDDRAIIASVHDELERIDNVRTNNGFTEPGDLCLEVYIHLRSLLDRLSLLISSEIGANAAISLKLLWDDGDNTPVIRTFLRDQESEAMRSHYRPPNKFSPQENTAFSYILYDSDEFYFCADSLLSLNAEGRYINSNPYWQKLYNSTAVSTVFNRNSKTHEGMLGFLCADSKAGSLKSRKVRHLLDSFSEHIYNCYKVVSAETGSFLTNEIEMGWLRSNGQLLLADTDEHRSFQEVTQLMEAAFFQKFPNSARERFYPSQAEEIANAHYPRGVRAMSDHDNLELVFGADDSDLDPELLAAVSAPVSDKKFVRILEKISPYDSYAKDMLDLSRKKNIGQ